MTRPVVEGGSKQMNKKIFDSAALIVVACLPMLLGDYAMGYSYMEHGNSLNVVVGHHLLFAFFIYMLVVFGGKALK
jgi:hypothetical protein